MNAVANDLRSLHGAGLCIQIFWQNNLPEKSSNWRNSTFPS